MKTNKNLIQFLSICIIILQINTLFLKEKPNALVPENTNTEKTTETEVTSEKSEPECIKIIEITPIEPIEPIAPKEPIGFCAETPKIEKEEIILKKENGQPEKIVEKVIIPADKGIEKEIPSANIVVPDGNVEKKEIIEKEIVPKVEDKEKETKVETQPEPESEPKIDAEEKEKIIEGIKKNNKAYHSVEPIEHCFTIEHPHVDEEALRADIMKNISILDELKEIPTKKEEVKPEEEKPEEITKEETEEEEKPEEETEDIVTKEEPVEIKTKEEIVTKEEPEETKAKEEPLETKTKVEETEPKKVLPILGAEKISEEEKPKKEILIEHKKIGSDILTDIKTELGIKDDQPKIIEPDQEFEICRKNGAGIRVDKCPCKEHAKQIAEKILEEKEKKIKGESFIQLNSFQDIENIKTKSDFPEDFFDKAIAKTDSLTDSTINANALNNSSITGKVNAESNQSAIANSRNNSGAISNSKGKINTVSNLNANTNSNIDHTSNSNLNGNAVSDADNNSFAASDNKGEIEHVNNIDAKSSSDILNASTAKNIGFAGSSANDNSVAISNSNGKNTQNSKLEADIASKIDSISNVDTSTNSNSKADKKSIARTNSDSQGIANNDLNSLDNSVINSISNVESRANSDAIANDGGNGLSISDSKSKGEIKGKAAEKSKLNLIINNKDAARSLVNSSKGKKLEVLPVTPNGETEPKLKINIVKKPEIAKCIIPEITKKDNGSLRERIDEFVKNAKKEKEEEKLSPALKADIEKEEIKKIEEEKKELKEIEEEKEKEKKPVETVLPTDFNNDSEEVSKTQEIETEPKTETKEPEVDIEYKEPETEKEVKESKMEEEEKIPTKKMIIDVKDCKGPSEDNKFDYKIFGDDSKTGKKLQITGSQKYRGGATHYPIHGNGKSEICDFDICRGGDDFGVHSHDLFDDHFFTTETFPKRVPRMRKRGRGYCHPHPFAHDYPQYGYGFEGKEFQHHKIPMNNYCISQGERYSDKKRLRGPSDRRINNGKISIPVNGGNGEMPIKKRIVDEKINGEEKYPQKDMDILGDEKKITEREDIFKVGDNEINYQKVCIKICADKNLPKSSGNESKTGTDGLTVFRCSCGDLKTNWFKSGKPNGEELQVEEIIPSKEIKLPEEKEDKKTEEVINVIQKPIECEFETPKIPMEDTFDFDYFNKKPNGEKIPILKAGEEKEKIKEKETEKEKEKGKDVDLNTDFLITKPEIKPIDMKEHVGGFIDKNANKIKGVSAHFLDAIDSLTDRKIKEAVVGQ